MNTAIPLNVLVEARSVLRDAYQSRSLIEQAPELASRAATASGKLSAYLDEILEKTKVEVAA